MIQTKFETKSKRVKGLSFHKYRPWILASLHNGSINLFDYRASVLLEKFEDHDGPVRGVNFHQTQPLFVSGGDDHKVKVWNYKTKKCLFTLTGHLDYIRTVEFHNELPWICSSSDDQTVRIWNWQNRSVIAILTGHSHYVMSATFHPEDTLLASASLDQTIRIWDFAKLKEKSMQKQGSRPNEIFGGTEVEVKHILEGHEKGVNWVAFHPTSRVVASGADDKTIKLWRLSGNKHWEMDTLKGHANNVSCCIFHPRMEILISNSEDKTLRVWDMNRRVQIHQMRKDTDRFWILAAHPQLNYFAAGYDNGMMVFKLERECYQSARIGSSIFFVKNKNLYFHDLSSKDKAIMAPVNSNGKQVLANQPKTVYYNYFNQSSHDIILNFDTEGGCFIIYEFHKDLKNVKLISEKRGDYTLAATFISKDKICILDQNRELAVCNFDGSNLKKLQVNKKGTGKIDTIFPAPLGKVIIQSDDSILLYDISARKVINELQSQGIKRVYWNQGFTFAAVITKTQILIVNKTLEVVNQSKENAKIKTGCFDENQAFIYSTSTHFKYIFTEGKTTGTFKSVDEPYYVSFFMKNQVYAFNRQGELDTIEINNTDYLFKLALQQKNLQEVKEILSQGNLCGHSIVSYLKESGHSEIALFFEQDLKQRFNLAIASGNISVAFEAAKELKEKDNFLKLAQTALVLGNYEITEKCYQIVRSFDKLNFFYLTSGSSNKLKKMQQVSMSVNDPMLRYNTSLLLGDVQERVKLLAEAGQIPLAYLMAKSHGLAEFEKTLEESIRNMEGVDQDKIIEQAEQYSRRSKALLPLRPIFVANDTFQSRDWPMINLRAKEAERAAQMFQKRKEPELATEDDMFFDAKEFHTSNKEVANILTQQQESNQKKTASAGLDVGDAAWGSDEELDIDADNMMGQEETNNDVDQIGGTTENSEGSDIFVPPSQGADPLHAAIRRNPLICGLHIASGDFQKGLELLKKQLAITNFQPLKQLFVDIFTLNKMKIQTLPHISPLDYTLRQSNQVPYVAVNMSNIMPKVARGLDLTSKGDFQGALESFRTTLQSIPLMALTNAKDFKEVQQIIRKISEYIVAMRIELERKKVVAQTSAENVRGLELGCYMTLCAMESAHKFLAFKTAMNNNYKVQNNITAAHFARLVLDLEPTGIFASKPETIPQFRKYYQAFQTKGTNAVKLNFDNNLNVELKEINGYLCSGSLTPLEDNRSVSTVRCPLDGCVYSKSFAGSVCQTCQLCKLGEDAVGLNILLEGESE